MKWLEDQSFKKKKIGEDEDDDVDKDFVYDSVLRMYNKPKQINEVDAYLDGAIGAPYNYRNLLHYLRIMEPEDKLRLWVNSPGGQLDSALDIIESLQKTEGQVQVIVSGRAYSAASLIALSAPNLIVGDNATFMCHHGRQGYGGKSSDVVSYVTFSNNQLESAMRKAYKDFLTEQEIELMFVGKDYWFDNKETVSRLERRNQIQQQELAKAKKKPRQVKVEKVSND